MKLPKFAIDKYPFTLVVFIMLLIMGVSSFLTMPRTEDPPMDLPGASVFVIYPGGNPVDLEELIADPLEKTLNELEDVKELSSEIKDGIVATSIEFNFDTDPDDKFDEVVRQVNSVRSELPEDIYDLMVMKWSSTDVIILQLALVSETSGLPAMKDAAEELKDELEKLSGVRKVEIHASPEEQLRVSLDLDKMAALKISADDVARAIQSNNANIPGGEIRLGQKRFNVKTSGSYKDPDEIRNTVVSSYQGSLIYIRDIAEVGFANDRYNYRARVNGEKALFLTLKQKEGLNIYRIFEGVDPVVERFQTKLPPGMKLITVLSQAESVDSRINGFFNNLVQGIVLVGILIFLSLGFRASLLVIIAIPLSIVISLGWLDTWGFGLQQISIAGLVIALGLLVDNSIVITENIERFVQKNSNREKAAIEATSQLAMPIIAATLTTILAFIPIIAMPNEAGRFVQSLPVTVILTLVASLLIALTLTPFLASRFFKPKAVGRKERGVKKALAWIIHRPYTNTLRFALRKGWMIILLALLTLAGSGFVFNRVGVSFFPKAEKPQFLIRIQVPDGYSVDKPDEVSRYVESVLDTMPEVKYYASNIGHGNPRVYYNTFPRRYEQSFAEILVILHRYEVQEFDDVITSLRETFSNYPGARISLKEFEQGTPIEAPVTIKITGENLDSLEFIADEVLRYVKQTPGILNAENNLARKSTDMWFKINREKANLYGVAIHTIDMTLRTAIAGNAVSRFRDKSGEEFDIVLRLPADQSIKINDLQKIYLKSMTGEIIPLSQLVSIEFKKAPGIISHYNLSRVATITADIEKGYLLDEVISAIEPGLKAMNWSNDYSYKFTGELESRSESFGGMGRASLIAIIAIFAVLVLQFGSFRQPLIIFSAIPLAIVGSTFALFITGYTFSFTAFIGLISLIGIVINNSIILVDYANILRSEGKALDEAIMEAGKARFTPIILTTLTTIGGLLPLTLQGGSLWAPMGWTIIGGLLVSTFLTLVIVPVLYRMLTPIVTAEAK